MSWSCLYPWAVGLCLVASACAQETSPADPIPLRGSCPEGHVEWREDHGDGTRSAWCKDASGLADGSYTVSDDDGVLVTGTFVNGKPHGRWVWTSRDTRTITREGDYADGLPHGAFVDYDADGVVRYERAYEAGEPCGHWVAYDGAVVAFEQRFDPCPGEVIDPELDPDLVAPTTTDRGWDGVACPGGAEPTTDGSARACLPSGPYGFWDGDVKLIDGAYTDGAPSGTWRHWHPSGGLRMTGAFGAGGETGVWKTWRADGSLAARGTYVDGAREGAWQTFHSNGVEASSGSYSDDLRSGTWRFRRADGTVEADYVYAAGARTGAATEYLHDGLKGCEGALADDLRQGIWQCWHDNGEERSRVGYQRGQLHGPGFYFDRAGEPTLSGRWDHGVAHGTFTAWEELGYFEGSPPLRARRSYTVVHGLVEGLMTGVYEDVTDEPRESEVRYVLGVREGAWTQWYPSGGVGVQGYYLQGLPHGHWRVYYEAGALQVDEHFWQGALHEQYREYWQDGSPRVIGLYAYGTPQGTFTFFDADGTPRNVDCGSAPEVCP